MDGVLSDVGDVVMATPRHPAVAEVNAKEFTKATSIEKCKNCNIVGTCHENYERNYDNDECNNVER